MRNLLIGLFAGVFLAGFPMGMVIKKQAAEIEGWKQASAEIIRVSTGAMQSCVGKLRDAGFTVPEPNQ